MQDKLLRAIERQKTSEPWMCTIYRARAGGSSRRKQERGAAYSVKLLEGYEFDIVDSDMDSEIQAQQAYQNASIVSQKNGGQVRSLRENGDVMAAKVQYLYDRGEYTSCLHITSNLVCALESSITREEETNLLCAYMYSLNAAA